MYGIACTNLYRTKVGRIHQLLLLNGKMNVTLQGPPPLAMPEVKGRRLARWTPSEVPCTLKQPNCRCSVFTCFFREIFSEK